MGFLLQVTNVNLCWEAITDLVKRGNTLLGSINSSRADFEDAIAFIERVIGDEKSILNDVTDRNDILGMVTRLPIKNDDLPDMLTEDWAKEAMGTR